MYRKIMEYFEDWAGSPIRTPLIVRGARQVGKSFVIRQFGQTHFKNLVEINLETQPEFHACFNSLNARRICADIEAMTNIPIVPGETLLFIDEVQISQQALSSLRSFKETMVELHVIAAGSLLEFALRDPQSFSFPVGRVTFAHLAPLSFSEFLLAQNERGLLKAIAAAEITEPLSEVVHGKCLDLVRTYFMVGGMPEVVNTYCKTQSIADSRHIQNRLTTAFAADFAKYGRRYDHRKLERLLAAIPRLLGKKFKYSHVDSDVSARDLKQPLLDLERAGLVRLVRATSAGGVPLGSEERAGTFKALYLDVGLMLNALKLNLYESRTEDALFVNEGAIAEQFVGQEILAYGDPESSPQLFYWVREAKNAEAEVDFVIEHNHRVIPVEVKAGATGRLRSLRQFMLEKDTGLGIRISQQPLSFIDGVLSVPFYMCAEIPRLIRHCSRQPPEDSLLGDENH